MRWWRYELNPWSRVTSFCNFRVHLFTRQLTTFTWFSTLSTFNLQLFCMNEVIRSYTETTRGDLFDFGVHAVAVWQWFEASYIFTAFTRVRCRAKAVHSDSNRFMRLFTDGTITHSTRFKAFYDRFFRLNLFNWNTATYWVVQFHQGAQCNVVIIANRFRILFIFSIVAIDKGFL